MAHIATVDPRHAGGELREAYRQIRRDMVSWRPLPLDATVWNIMRVFSLRPALLRAFERCFVLTMWVGALDRQAREAIGVTVAQTNRCHY